MKLLSRLLGATCVLVLGLSAVELQSTSASAQEGKPKIASTQKVAAKPVDAQVKAQLPLYPATTCLVSGEELGAMGDTVNMMHEGRLVRLCCKGCVKSFKKDPKAMLAKLDAMIVKQQAAAYPVKTCLVSGEALGSMGDVLDVVHGTRLVRLCCKGCVKGMKKDPAALMAKLDAAYIAAQKPTYPVKTCLVSGEALGADSIDVLHGNTLVRLCCAGCKKGFAKDPAAMVAKVHSAAKAAKGAK